MVVSRSPEETQAIGAELAAELAAGDVVACLDELGAGKTCFLRADEIAKQHVQLFGVVSSRGGRWLL